MPDIRNMRKSQFAWVENEIAQNPHISLRALGLYTLMVSYPNDWVYHLNHLAEQKTDSLYSTRQAFRELLDAELVVREQARDDDNQFAGYEYHVIGMEPVSQIPVCRNPVDGDSVDGQSHTTKKQDTKKQSTNKQNKEKEKESSRSVSKQQAQDLVDTYNEHRGSMKHVRLLSENRESRLRTLIKRYGFDDAKDLLIKATKERAAEGWYATKGYGLDELLKLDRVVQYAEAWDHQQTQQQQQAQPDVHLMTHEKRWAYDAAAEQWLALPADEAKHVTIEELAERHEERMLNEKRNRNQNN